MYDIQVLSLYEYEARMHAYRLKQVDESNKMHMQAWFNHSVTATKEKGGKQVPVYQTYKEFFDYEKEIKKVEKELGKEKVMTNKQKRMAQAAKRMNERR